jgi:hypothetical protein
MRFTWRGTLFWDSSQTDWLGRAVVQAVIRRLPIAAVRVPAQVRSCRICGGRSGTGAGFLRVFRFCHSFHRLLHTRHHASSGAGTIGRMVAAVPSGLSLTQPEQTGTTASSKERLKYATQTAQLRSAVSSQDMGKRLKSWTKTVTCTRLTEPRPEVKWSEVKWQVVFL